MLRLVMKGSLIGGIQGSMALDGALDGGHSAAQTGAFYASLLD
jgi:hypothetical protein